MSDQLPSKLKCVMDCQNPELGESFKIGDIVDDPAKIKLLVQSIAFVPAE